VFTKNRTNPAYEGARLGADRAARLLGAQTEHYVPEKGDDPGQQEALVDEALARRPDAFVFTPVHPVRMNAALERIHAAGIPLCGFVNPIPVGPCVTYVAADDYQLGSGIAQFLFERMEGRGTVLLIGGWETSPTGLARVKAFRDAAARYPGIRLAGPDTGDYDRGVARACVERRLAAGETFDACLAANDAMALGAFDALGAAGRRALIAGVNAVPEAIAAIRRGEMVATADFNAMNMAYLATECAIRHLRGERVPAIIELPVEIVDRHNCHRWDVPYGQRTLLSLEETLQWRKRDGSI
jgi:ribose transport system substrate-binding protein